MSSGMLLNETPNTAKRFPYAGFMAVTKSTAAIFAENVRTLMQRRKLTQDQLGKKAGISQRHVSSVLRQENAPTAEIIGKIAGAFNLPAWLLLVPNLPPELLDSTELPSVVDRYMSFAAGR